MLTCNMKLNFEREPICVVLQQTSIKELGIILSHRRNDHVKELLFNQQKGIEFLPDHIAESFPKLRNLNARECSLQWVGYRNFERLRFLEQFSLSDNQLLSFDDDSFDDLEDVVTINLNNNRITSLPEMIFAKLLKLQNLLLASNRLTHLSSNVFQNNFRLKRLFLSHNKLSSFASGTFESLTHLREIILLDNNIKSLSVSLFDHSRWLKVIDISDNQIKEIPPNFLWNFHELREFSFSNNPLEVFDFATFDNNRKLFSIKIPPNWDVRINNIEKIYEMEKLEKVTLKNGQCRNIFYRNDFERLTKVVVKGLQDGNCNM